MEDEHNLKTWPAPFVDTWKGEKTFEIRKFDRDYKVGDVVRLFEYYPTPNRFTGRYVRARIEYVMEPGQWGLPKDTGVFTIKVCEQRQIDPARAESWCSASGEEVK